MRWLESDTFRAEYWSPINIGVKFAKWHGPCERTPSPMSPSWKAGMTINGYLTTLKQPRLWLTVAFVVSHLLQFGPCCCSRGHGSAQSANCCCGDSAGEEDASDNVAFFVHDEVSEAPLPHKCRCNKNVCSGTKAELFTVPDHRANCFDHIAQPTAPITFNVVDARTLGMEGRRRDVVALRGADCCTVLCRWLC